MTNFESVEHSSNEATAAIADNHAAQSSRTLWAQQAGDLESQQGANMIATQMLEPH